MKIYIPALWMLVAYALMDLASGYKIRATSKDTQELYDGAVIRLATSQASLTKALSLSEDELQKNGAEILDQAARAMNESATDFRRFVKTDQGISDEDRDIVMDYILELAKGGAVAKFHKFRLEINGDKTRGLTRGFWGDFWKGFTSVYTFTAGVVAMGLAGAGRG